MFRRTQTANAVSLAAPVLRLRSPIRRYSDSRGNLIWAAISLDDAPDASPRRRIVSSAVNRGITGELFAASAATGDALFAVGIAVGGAAVDCAKIAAEPADVGGVAGDSVAIAEVAVNSACLNSTDFKCPRVAISQSVSPNDRRRSWHWEGEVSTG